MKFKTLNSIIVAAGFAAVPPLVFAVEPVVATVANPAEEEMGILPAIPADTELLMQGTNLYRELQKFSQTPLGGLLDFMIQESGEDMTFSEFLKSPEALYFKSVVGEEVFVSFGKGTAEQFSILNDFTYSYNSWTWKYYMVNMVSAMEGDMQAIQAFAQTMLKDIFNHEKFGPKKLAKLKLPPIMAGFKVSDKKQREELLLILKEGLEMALMSAPPELGIMQGYNGKHFGSDFSGFKINGNIALSLFEGQLKELEAMGMQIMPPADLKFVIEALKKRNIFVTVGGYQDYIVFYVGDEMDGLKFAKDPASSIIEHKDFAYFKDYQKKDRVFLSHATAELTKNLAGEYGSFEAMAEGLVLGMEQHKEKFGDTKKFRQNVAKTAEAEKKFVQDALHGRLGMVAYAEDGFKIDFVGGVDPAKFDAAKQNPLTKFALAPETFMASYWSSNRQDTVSLADMLEYGVKASYEAVVILDRSIKENPNSREAKKFFTTMRSYGPLAVEFVSSMTGMMRDGLGDSSALVMDFQGKFPELPDMPRVLAERAKCPRISVFFNVQKPDAVKKSWKGIQASVDELAAKMVEDAEMPTPKVKNLDYKGLKWSVYYFEEWKKGITPCFGFNDSFWTMTSDAMHASSILSAPTTGTMANYSSVINFSALDAYLESMGAMMEKHKDQLADGGLNDVGDMSRLLDAYLGAKKKYDKLTTSSKLKNGEILSTLHLSTK